MKRLVCILLTFSLIFCLFSCDGDPDNWQELVLTEHLEGGCSVAVGNATYLSEIVISDVIDGRTITGISANGFDRCQNLKSVTIGGSVKVIKEYAFNQCFELRQVVLNEGLTEIGAYAFYNCRKLEEINLPESLEIIGERAFCDCTQLSEIYIPAGVKSIGEDAFDLYSYKLDKVYFGGDEATWKTLVDGTGLEDVVVEFNATR